jgi:hypothetical protein
MAARTNTEKYGHISNAFSARAGLHSSVGIAVKLEDLSPRNGVSIPDRNKNYFSSSQR